ncbi:uncharacterized protein LOC144745061 isoform X2 [Ciona intestinalis]
MKIYAAEELLALFSCFTCVEVVTALIGCSQPHERLMDWGECSSCAQNEFYRELLQLCESCPSGFCNPANQTFNGCTECVIGNITDLRNTTKANGNNISDPLVPTKTNENGNNILDPLVPTNTVAPTIKNDQPKSPDPLIPLYIILPIAVAAVVVIGIYVYRKRIRAYICDISGGCCGGESSSSNDEAEMQDLNGDNNV